MDQPELMMNLKFDSGECCICYSTPQVIKASLACGHVFCRSCLMRWSEKRNICPTCVQEFDHFVYKNANNGKTEIMQIVPAPKVDPHRTPIWIVVCTILLMLLNIPFLVLLESQLNFLQESYKNLIIIVTAAIVVFCGVRIRVHHDGHQLGIEIWYDPRALSNLTFYLNVCLLIIILIPFNALEIQWRNALPDFWYGNV